jgi:hypothetical protein
MWERITEVALPAELARVTTSTWHYPGYMILGVMRTSLLCPPCIWAEVIGGGVRKLRRVPGILDDFQRLIYAPTIYAEAACELPRNQAVLRFAGFHEITSREGRVLFERSI